jgi:hypothetical protein
MRAGDPANGPAHEIVGPGNDSNLPHSVRITHGGPLNIQLCAAAPVGVRVGFSAVQGAAGAVGDTAQAKLVTVRAGVPVIPHQAAAAENAGVAFLRHQSAF